MTQIRVALEKVHAGEFFPVKEDDENYTSDEERMINLKYSSNNNNAIKRSSMAPPEMIQEASAMKTADALNTASAVLLPLKPSSSTSSISHDVSIHETSDTEAEDTEPEHVEEKKQLKSKDDDPNV